MPKIKTMTLTQDYTAAILQARKNLKSTSVSNLRDEWNRIFRVGDAKSLDKEGLVIDILIAKFGKKKYRAAFNK